MFTARLQSKFTGSVMIASALILVGAVVLAPAAQAAPSLQDEGATTQRYSYFMP
ncbi:hypothetical protein [Lentzea sp.]|uniref:hypothetical protein n=1 Tax=Lentzea sp. TaxID=56099 RepID=UPI002C3D80E5|nr:hypothetical protein [Lentzea sp.]HUQ60787.1 hypothetical protein [Lentzea sp.]